MKKKLTLSLVIGVALASALGAGRAVAACTPTGFIRDAMDLTAAVIANGDISGQTIDATGCNIGIYYGPGTGGTVESSEVFGSNYFGIVVTGEDSLGNLGTTSVDVTSNNIHDIGEKPFNGTQHGVAVYYYAFSDGASATGAISGNTVHLYQKGGIVANGPNAGVSIGQNTVTGNGPVPYIAQNGIDRPRRRRPDHAQLGHRAFLHRSQRCLVFGHPDFRWLRGSVDHRSADREERRREQYACRWQRHRGGAGQLRPDLHGGTDHGHEQQGDQ
jgi:hypothetical protein